MINVHAHPERMMFRENRAKLGRDPLRQENRNAGADAQKFDVLDRAQPRRQLVDLIIAENQRVAATQEHVAHFGVLFEITERFFEIGMQLLFADSADDTTTGAIAAIRRASIGYQKQNAIGIAMNKS